MEETTVPNTAYKLAILFTGYSQDEEDHNKSNCTSTLIQTSDFNIIIDTLTAWDGEAMVDKLKEHHLTPNDIHFCICTHGHSDHVGCNYLFQKAKHFIGTTCFSHKHTYFTHNFASPYTVCPNLEIIATPGHSGEDISVIARIGDKVYAVVGDLFENEHDIENEHLWKEKSTFPTMQEESRHKILNIADYIVPGHGPLFPNPCKLK